MCGRGVKGLLSDAQSPHTCVLSDCIRSYPPHFCISPASVRHASHAFPLSFPFPLLYIPHLCAGCGARAADVQHAHHRVQHVWTAA